MGAAVFAGRKIANSAQAHGPRSMKLLIPVTGMRCFAEEGAAFMVGSLPPALSQRNGVGAS